MAKEQVCGCGAGNEEIEAHVKLSRLQEQSVLDIPEETLVIIHYNPLG